MLVHRALHTCCICRSRARNQFVFTGLDVRRRLRLRMHRNLPYITCSKHAQRMRGDQPTLVHLSRCVRVASSTLPRVLTVAFKLKPRPCGTDGADSTCDAASSLIKFALVYTSTQLERLRVYAHQPAYTVLSLSRICSRTAMTSKVADCRQRQSF